MKKYFRSSVLFFSAAVLAAACARVGAPPGGPKDVTPPRVLEYQPPNQTVNFRSKSIEIRFDEFIVLDQVNKKLIISPPLEEKPEIRLKGKGLIIKLPGPLRDSTTYTFNFGDAIRDLNENNILENFTYVFSTGPELDSLQVHGQVLEARDLTAPEDAVVMLYEDLSDSAPLLEKPLYVSKANPYGMFLLKNLKADTFRLYALVDGNANYRYDPGGDEVAFFDTLLVVTPGPDFNPFPDSLVTDSVYEAPGRAFRLFLFREDKELPYLKSYDRPVPWFLTFIFSTSSPGASVHLVDTTLTGWQLREPSVTGDTLALWITDTLLVRQEKLRLAVTYRTLDTLGRPVMTTDTVTLRTKPPKGKGKKKKVPHPELTMASSLSGRTQDLNVPLLLETSLPVDSVDTTRLYFVRVQDSLTFDQPYRLERDTTRLRRYRLVCSWQEGASYRLVLYPGLFRSIYGPTHDTITLEFRTATLEDYGTLALNITPPAGTFRILLTDTKEEKVIRRATARSDTTILFEYLKPGNYIVKAILDSNGNGRWDPGNLLEKIQPEKVCYFPKQINIKANWDVEEDWTLTPGEGMNPFRLPKPRRSRR